MERAIKEIVKSIETKSEETPYFGKKGYKAYPISKNNFKEIKSIKTNKKIAFIDGGNQEIISSSNFSLQLMKVHYCIYETNKRIKNKTFETYALISAGSKDTMGYNVKLFFKSKTLDFENLWFTLDDTTMMMGEHNVKIETIADTTRKLLELKTASNLCDKLSNCVIVLDRTLEATVTGEEKLFEEIYFKAQKNNVSITAIAKTNSILTKSGNSFSAILNQIGPDAHWTYYPITDIESPKHKAKMYIVKLHPKTKHTFRLEVNNENINEVLSLLVENSKDPVFLGYPYGLIDADKNARVSNKEVEILKTRLFVKLGKDFKKISAYLNTKNAHDILDSIG
ncbi:DNA double-strand break repair nuclease NurA [Candidatus Woesearchaeota archaeon]|nr:DNA double-strand break repair nuclease NurA [Candidatus Woesearchaeota archaeon]